MAAFNVSLDDSSPLISYSPSGAWTDTPSNDTLAQSYAAKSLHVTHQQDASATFKFNGTGVWLFGGFRFNYGSYSLSVDGNTVKTGSARSSDARVGQLLGGVSDLDMGEHTAVLTSSDSSPIDLDSIVFETKVGSSNGTVSSSTLDDGDNKISFSPSSDWGVSNNDLFSGGSVHFAQKGGAEASFSFSGDALAISGGSSFDHGDYEVSIDGQSHQLNGGSNGAMRVYHPQFFASNLGHEQHNVTVASRGNDSTPFLDLDSITIYQNSNSTDDESGGMGFGDGMMTPQVNQAQANASGDASQGLSKSAVVGLVVSILLAILLLIALVLFLIVRSRQRKLKRKQRAKAAEMASPVFPLQDPDLEAGQGYFSEKQIPQIPVPEPAVIPRYQVQDNPRPGLPAQPGVYLGGVQQASELDRRKTTNTRWSQASFASTDSTLTDYYHQSHPKPHDSIPPVPPLPTALPLRIRNRSTAYTEASDDSTRDFADYYRDSVLVVPDVTKTPPVRPARPPDLRLDLDGPEFDSIQL
ncbi:unnamed protein product [Somion occarium]|uniref:Uncharacterized protein n=1 Tax=Somion occarium TaxID=3059160 RepID=A0ABP1DHA6_9APHY